MDKYSANQLKGSRWYDRLGKIVSKSAKLLKWLSGIVVFAIKRAFKCTILSIVHKGINLAKGWINRTEDRPRDWLGFILVGPVTLALSFFCYSFIKWLPGIDLDSAKWGLSTQTQATAAFLGLLIAAVVFRLHSVTDKETQLREIINEYITRISCGSDTSESKLSSMDSVYAEYHSLVTGKKLADEKKQKEETKTAVISLGRLWVIKKLSLNYNSSVFPPRILKKSETKPLYQVDKLTGESAINMWEHYFTRPSDFILEMYEALTAVCFAAISEGTNKSHSIEDTKDTITFAQKYSELESLRIEIFKAPWKFEAERFKRTRKDILPRFYASFIILFFAVILGMISLIGVNNPESIKDFLEPYTLRWLVGPPIGLSILGLWVSLLTILRVVR